MVSELFGEPLEYCQKCWFSDKRLDMFLALNILSLNRQGYSRILRIVFMFTVALKVGKFIAKGNLLQKIFQEECLRMVEIFFNLTWRYVVVVTLFVEGIGWNCILHSDLLFVLKGQAQALEAVDRKSVV